MEIKRTNSENPNFIELVRLLDANLAITDGEDHAFYSQFNKLDNINQVVLIMDNNEPIACGAIKPLDKKTMEIKRMFTKSEHCSKGYATIILGELESWAKALGAVTCVLETGIRQESAIALYKKNGYNLMPNYGQYIGIEESYCFKKELF